MVHLSVFSVRAGGMVMFSFLQRMILMLKVKVTVLSTLRMTWAPFGEALTNTRWPPSGSLDR